MRQRDGFDVFLTNVEDSVGAGQGQYGGVLTVPVSIGVGESGEE